MGTDLSVSQYVWIFEKSRNRLPQSVWEARAIQMDHMSSIKTQVISRHHWDIVILTRLTFHGFHKYRQACKQKHSFFGSSYHVSPLFQIMLKGLCRNSWYWTESLSCCLPSPPPTRFDSFVTTLRNSHDLQWLHECLGRKIGNILLHVLHGTLGKVAGKDSPSTDF